MHVSADFSRAGRRRRRPDPLDALAADRRRRRDGPDGPGALGPALRGVGHPPQLPGRRPARAVRRAGRGRRARRARHPRPADGDPQDHALVGRGRHGRALLRGPRLPRRRRRPPPPADRRPGPDAAPSRTSTTSPGSSPPSSPATRARSCSTPTSPSAAARWSATRSARSRTRSTTSRSSTPPIGVSHENTEEQNLASLRRMWSGSPEDAEHRSRRPAGDPLAVDGVRRAQRRVRLHLRVRRDRPRRQPGAGEPRRDPRLPAVHPARRAAPARVDRRRGRRPPADQGPRRARALPADRRRGGRGLGATPPASVAASAGLPLDAVRIGHVDGDLFDPRCTWLRHREIGADGAILVRPDRFVAWRSLGAADDPAPSWRPRSCGPRPSLPTAVPAERRTDDRFERYDEIYRLPRAVHLDHEIMRLLQRLGVADAVAGDMLAASEYHWLGADGEPIMTLTAPVPAVSGWESGLPVLPARARARARRAARGASRHVSVERGWTAEARRAGRRRRRRSALAARRRDARTVRARWVVGADGANSFVREAARHHRAATSASRSAGSSSTSSPRDMAALDLPAGCQWCDPRRPTTHVQSGTRHRRWEFMLLPGERAEDFDEERAWELLAPWFTPGGRPPHAARGLRVPLDARRPTCATGRALAHRRRRPPDAAVPRPGPVRGPARRREPRVEARPRPARRRARTRCSTPWSPSASRRPSGSSRSPSSSARCSASSTPSKAAERDATLRAAGPPPAARPRAARTGGALHRDGDGRSPERSRVQGRVARDDREGLLDDVTGGGFTLIARERRPARGARRPPSAPSLDALGAAVVSLDPAAPPARATSTAGRPPGSTSTASTPSSSAPTSTSSAAPPRPPISPPSSTTCATGLALPTPTTTPDPQGAPPCPTPP